MALGNVPDGVDIVLVLGGLGRILLHEPADLVASVEAGVKLKTLQEDLARSGQYLPVEAPLPHRATVGGILAANANGPSRLAYGTARDWLIGIRVVRSDGVVTKSGGRVVKNVTGYDLNKLYTGSLGTLGVIVEATFKLAPLPTEKRTLFGAYSSLSAAVESAEALLRQSFTPHALQVMDGEIIGRLPGMGARGDQGAAVLVLFEGRRGAVDRKANDSASAMGLTSAGAIRSLTRSEGDILWQAVTDLGWEEDGAPDLVAKVSILPSQVREFLAMTRSLDDTRFRRGHVADVGYGSVRLLWWTDGGQPTPGENLLELVYKLRAFVRQLQGHVVVEKCPLEVKQNIDVWGDSVDSIGIMRRVKQQLDPEGILSPGRLAGRI